MGLCYSVKRLIEHERIRNLQRIVQLSKAINTQSPSDDWVWDQNEDDGKGGWIYQQTELNSAMVMFGYDSSWEYGIIFHKPYYRRSDYSSNGTLAEAMKEAETQYWHHVNND